MFSSAVTIRYQQLESEAGLCFSEARTLYCDLKEGWKALNHSLELRENHSSQDSTWLVQSEMDRYNQMSENLETAFLKYWFT